MATKKKAKKKVLPYDPPAHMRNDLDVNNTTRYDDVYYALTLGTVQSVEAEGSQSFLIQGDGKITLRIEIWSDRCIRFRYGIKELKTDFSYARTESARPTSASVSFQKNATGWVIDTEVLRCSIKAQDGTITISEKASGTTVHEYATAFQTRTTLMKGLDQVRIQLTTEPDDGFFGLGDKSWETDLHGRYYQNWCTDSFAYGYDSDHLYRAIPFFMGLKASLAYGIFLDNTYRTHFDFNSNRDGLTTIWADGGEFDYYFFFGPELNTVAKDYVQLTGTPELPPLWSLGFHQCRWSYYPEKRVRDLAKNFREKQFPCDAIYLDIDYMNDYRCFTWNNNHFPDPKSMISDLKEEGFHTVVMIDPGIKVDEEYHVYQSGSENEVWCKRKSGEDMEGPVWPPECVWPDYTNPEVRDWWGPLYQELYNEQGVSGFWNDMNEPAVFKVNSLTFPEDVQHDYEGHGADHKQAHNIYGMQMSRATYDGLKALQPAKRPFLLCRASYSGGQRYAALWTGDNVASWDHLAIANRQCIRLSISGFSFVGTDIGGFVDDPSGELMVRWLQLGIFHPVMRIHSMGNNEDGATQTEAEAVQQAEAENRQDQEPWVYGEPYTSQARQAIEQRYQLLPYLYTAFKQHLDSGLPLLRNLFFEDQADELCRKYGDQFLCGKDIMVAPVVTKGAKSMNVYFPQGSWVDFYSGRAYSGSKRYRIKLKADQIPMFVRAGAVIPTVEAVQHTGQLKAAKTLEMNVFLGADSGSGQLYWDAGDGYDYTQGDYLQLDFSVLQSSDAIQLQQSRKGTYQASFEATKITLVGYQGKATQATVDGKVIPMTLTKKGAVLTVPFQFSTLEVTP
ncbi:MAG: TIM-barrel domain-containing protein [Bacteroidota bacterium]